MLTPGTAVNVRSEGRVVYATFDRAGARNALSPALLDGFEAAIETAVVSGAHVLVLRGAGGNFSAGADLGHVESVLDDRSALGAYVSRIAGLLDRLEAAPFASVGVIEGFALAGGCEILLACDVSIAADDARIGDRHMEYGLVPGAGGSVRLPRGLVSARGRWLLLSGEMIDGRQAAEWGLVTFSAGPAELEGRIDAVVERLASRSLEALAMAKRMWNAARDVTVEDGIIAERALFLEHFTRSADAREGLAAFRERRRPSWSILDKGDKERE
jgi:enoyl-CoA hydratase